jgi:hypothetical protein
MTHSVRTPQPHPVWSPSCVVAPSPSLCLTALVTVPAALALPASAAPKVAPDKGLASAPAVAGELVVGYVEGASPGEQERARKRATAKKKERVVAGDAGAAEVELVDVPAGDDLAAAIAELEADPAVAYAEPNWIYTVQGTRSGPKVKPEPAQPAAAAALDYYDNGSLWGMYGDASTPANAYGSQAAEAWLTGSTAPRGRAPSTSASSTRACRSPIRT